MLFAATPDLLGDDEVISIPGAPPRLDHEIVGCAVPAAVRLGVRAVRDGSPAAGASRWPGTRRAATSTIRR